MYDVKSLFFTFTKHAKRFVKDRERMIKKFQKENPGKKLPSHMKDDFNIVLALTSICGELMKLRARIDK